MGVREQDRRLRPDEEVTPRGRRAESCRAARTDEALRNAIDRRGDRASTSCGTRRTDHGGHGLGGGDPPDRLRARRIVGGRTVVSTESTADRVVWLIQWLGNDGEQRKLEARDAGLSYVEAYSLVDGRLSRVLRERHELG